MEPLIGSPAYRRRQAIAFIAELIRLQREVRDVGRELARIESEMRHALNDITRRRFEEQR